MTVAARDAAPSSASRRRTSLTGLPSRDDVLEAGHEAGTPSRPILDPRVASVGLGVLGNEREAEARSDVVPARTAAREPFEDPRPLPASHARTRVLDADLHAPPAVAVDEHPRRSTGVLPRVLEQVGEHALE